MDTEAAAPAWADLLPELKRLELLGRVQRGYFIEPHPGEQYGLPEAIELLRECRGRRPEGGSLGYLPDEPLIVLSSRDPANLYASSLEILRQDGELFSRSQKGGNTCWRYIVQAGQVLIHESRQLVTLEREPLRRCFEALRRDPMDREQRVAFDDWNGYPVAVSPVAPVLQEAGYVWGGRGQLLYPPGKGKRASARAETAAKPASGDQRAEHTTFPPYYEESSPVTYGREWTLGLVDEERRLLLAGLLDLLVKLSSARGWEIRWHRGGMDASYKGKGNLYLGLHRRWFDVRVGTKPVRDAQGNRLRMNTWTPGHKARFTTDADLAGETAAHLERLLQKAEEMVNSAG